MKRVAALSLVLSSAVTSPRAMTSPPPARQGAPDAVRAKKADLKLKVIDGATKRPVRNTAVEIYSDNGIRCIRAPCPTNGIKWDGKTDAHGVVTVPGRVRQRSMAISATGYRGGKDLIRESKKGAGGMWIIALDADARPRR